LKLLIDRLRPYVENRKLEGKTAVVVSPAAEGPEACGPLVQMFEMSFAYLGMESRGALLATAYEKGEVERKPDELRKASDLGEKIAAS
jgi:hypothetical protein